MMFDWNDIRIFLAVAGEGSTLAASKKLAMNQTTVSRRMQALEQALGLTLFERDTRGYALTPQGLALIDVAGQLAAAAENLRLRAEHLARALDGTIRVAAAPSAMAHWVMPLISEFRRHNPDIHFQSNASEAHVSLEHGEADVAFRATDQITGDTLIARKLAPIRWGVYCSKAYLAEHAMPGSPEELGKHPYLSYPGPMVAGLALLTWLDRFQDRERAVGTVDSVMSMSASLRTEAAVGALPFIEGDPAPDLVRYFTHASLTSELWLVASREAHQQLQVRKFMKFVGEVFPKDGGPVRF